MKKVYQLIFAIFCFTSINAQKTTVTDTTKVAEKPPVPAYERLNEVPPFNLLLVNDSTMFAKANLEKKKPTMIFIFSPSCDHCKKATEEMIAKFDKFKNVNILMATVTKYQYAKKFYDENNLKNYPNIKMGVDADYFLGRFYEVRTYPAIFLYDKKGLFKKYFNSSSTMEDIAKFF